MPSPPLPPPVPEIAVSPAQEAQQPSPTSSSSGEHSAATPPRRPSDAGTFPSTAGYATSDGSPPSPTHSHEPLVGTGTTSTSLRDNLDPDGTRRAVEAASAMGGHARRPSQATSVASTVPDSKQHPTGTANSKSPADLEAGLDAMGKPHQLVNGKAVDVSNPGIEDSPVKDAYEKEKKKKTTTWGIFPKKQEAVTYVIKDPSPAEMAPFATDLTPSALYNLVDPKSYDHLASLGGTPGVLKGLKTSAQTGLTETGGAGSSVAEAEDRRRVYGENRVPAKKSKSFLELCWAAYTDKVLIILSVAAVVSLALGIYQSVGTEPDTYESTSCANNLCTEAQVDWVEGLAIIIAILIVVLVGSVNDWQKERQFQKLNAQKEERNVKVLRSGQERLMSVYDVLVGDILFIEPGEIVPVDGVFLAGHNVRCDESGATGESDAVRKASYEDLAADPHGKQDCFLISGSKVIEGVGRYVVTSVGRNSFHGKIMMSLQGDTEDTPLQLKLNALAELIAKLGSAAGLLLFIALMIRFFVQLKTIPNRSPDDKAQAFIQVLIIAVTVVVVAVPEGLPLAVTLALAFATRRMTKENLLVRVLGACETMANATVVCSDKTGTLTTNQMTVVAGSLGVHLKFVKGLEENSKRTNANDDRDPEKVSAEEAGEKGASGAVEAPQRTGRTDFSTDATDIGRHASPALQKLVNDSIVINSTAFEGTDEHGAEGGFVGSKTETALMTFAQNQGWAHYKAVREGAKVVQMIPFSSERKCMGVVVELPNNKGYRLFLKGASEVLARLSTRHVVVEENGADKGTEDDDVPTADFNDETRGNINRTIIFYACQSLRTIALCSRDFSSWPPAKTEMDDEGNVPFESLADDLTLIGVTAIEDPLREGVAKAVATCQRAGVMVKMCTGDNVLTARSIATQCGIFSKGGIIMEGPVFRKLTEQERLAVCPNLQVLARSSPEDKKILVETLKSMGEVVGVTGDGTNDGPALKAANVGFSMGIAGTEVAKEASDIILMDDNFVSIVAAIMWGRCVNDSVRKFLQFQLSVNITAVIITFVSAVASEEEESVLKAVQLLWVNLIMDTFAALALATDPADPEVLERKPDRKTSPLISVQMWIMIIGQAIYQIIVALVLHFAGEAIFGHSGTGPTAIDNTNDRETLVFNAFVFSQIFNMLNARRLDRKLNVFTGIWKNPYYLVIFLIMVGGQAIIVNFGGAAFHVHRIGWNYWIISIIIGFISMPIAVLLRLFVSPDLVGRWMVKFHLLRDPNKPELPSINAPSEELQWHEGITKLIDNLRVYSTIRGGRARASSLLRRKSRSKQLAEAGIHPTHIMAMLPTMVIGSVGGGWRPEGSLADPAAHDPSYSTQQLVDNGLGQLQGGGNTGHSRSPSVSNTLPPLKE
ncbi:hypothetical protein JCM6882_006083 [Rhodosporidiobolus microsporus]